MVHILFANIQWPEVALVFLMALFALLAAGATAYFVVRLLKRK